MAVIQVTEKHVDKTPGKNNVEARNLARKEFNLVAQAVETRSVSAFNQFQWPHYIPVETPYRLTANLATLPPDPPPTSTLSLQTHHQSRHSPFRPTANLDPLPPDPPHPPLHSDPPPTSPLSLQTRRQRRSCLSRPTTNLNPLPPDPPPTSTLSLQSHYQPRHSPLPDPPPNSPTLPPQPIATLTTLPQTNHQTSPSPSRHTTNLDPLSSRIKKYMEL
ncbi:lysine-rich arabinogalactan protein 19-like [Gigantopelta aegis]|uniref:lysine-rich arabinogalactan protein 19-like n=1 Tax=Gigantopelta aegis TaxID=1735272 RepID=UPI001B8875DC|nr:lysine-rich arabinogalactan protein 19-like [Gigantopelta aegis]